jgi:hypothetical protein
MIKIALFTICDLDLLKSMFIGQEIKSNSSVHL